MRFGWRNIPISLIVRQKGEQTVDACANAGFGSYRSTRSRDAEEKPPESSERPFHFNTRLRFVVNGVNQCAMLRY